MNKIKLSSIAATFISISIIALAIMPASHAGRMNRRSIAMKKKRIFFYTPQLMNPKYTSVEFGYLIRKRIRALRYSFNAYTNAVLTEEYYTLNEKLRAGSIGFKGGVILKTQPWFPFYLQLGFGFSKTALHEDPWFGVKDKSVSTRDMFLAEAGAIYRYKSFLVRYIYQVNNQDYFTKKQFVSIGANF